MNITPADVLVFNRYKASTNHAFSGSSEGDAVLSGPDLKVSEEDKDSYQRIFQHLVSAAESAIASSVTPNDYELKKCRFNRNGGVQGHRPTDLWISIVNRNSEDFLKFPQVYAIASESGFEIGFAVSIHEDDYYNIDIKKKSRDIVPIINSRLPREGDERLSYLSELLSHDNTWIYGSKARQGTNTSYANIVHLFSHLKAGGSTSKGGGSVYRLFTFAQILGGPETIEHVLHQTLVFFEPIMRLLRPSDADISLISTATEVSDISETLPPFDPKDIVDGKKKVLAQVAVRQGQAKFRDNLIEAYEGKCAVTRCNLLPVLQAAHISPYNGLQSNSVSNGILLRADIHTLFDLGLLRINPETKKVEISSFIESGEYSQFHGVEIFNPKKQKHKPSHDNLHYKYKS